MSEGTQWTEEQRAVIDFPLKRGDFLVVDAAAGCGKTCVAVAKCKKDAGPHNRHLLMMFGREDAEQARRRIGDDTRFVTTRTFDSMINEIFGRIGEIGWGRSFYAYADDVAARWGEIFADEGPLPDRYFKPKRKNDPGRRDLNEFMLKRDVADHVLPIINMFLCLQLPLDPLPEDAGELICKHIAQNHQATSDWWRLYGAKIGRTLIQRVHHIVNVSRTLPVMPEYARSAVASACASPGWDNERQFPFETIVIDEANDLNPNMVTWLMCQTHAARILVGDSMQHIYQFMHSNNAFSTIQNHVPPGVEVHRLSITHTFRFGSEIARSVNSAFAGRRIVGRNPAPGVVAHNSKLEDCVRAARRSEAKTVVLSRTNRQIAVNMVNTLEALHARVNPFTPDKRGDPVPWTVMGTPSLEKLNKTIAEIAVAEHDTRKRKRARDTSKLSEDTAAWEKWFVKTIGADETRRIMRTWEPAFTPNWEDALIVFSTVHRFKGKEREWAFCDESVQNHASDESRNIAYTAMTRARTRLVMGLLPPTTVEEK